MLPKRFMVFSDHVCLINLYFGDGWGNLRGKDNTTDISLIPLYIRSKIARSRQNPFNHFLNKAIDLILERIQINIIKR